jgi:hypothetical protein
MSDDDEPAKAEASAEEEIQAMLERVAAAMVEIEEAKRERSAEGVRAARTHLAALHGVARLRRHGERDSEAA